ncbi:DUF4249 domain-containing protein [Mucilaginibacter sp. SMC90]|uniref:DUF4249 domain-containing protein n=1 Tax=Mucilaginibacter sp. SMC90 TaxID=2929803 RepID=UPI001FB24D87|nr:DUF4249 domain-containing protein [Mucilaginibacter sp. SMC90]UOE49882.1 DUF4249 domain-containing protein [Mucilaginibacter sp. SMC90]
MPAVISSPNSYLIVEGLINTGSDSTFIKLSRTVKLNDKVATNPEKQALAVIESDNGSAYPLTEINVGTYAAAPLHLPASHKYRIRIKTSSNKEYLSDFVEAKVTPPVDSLSLHIKPDGLQINANAHDVTNSTRYYRWDYEETYQYRSKYDSRYKSNGDTVLPRDYINDQIYHCWRSDTSSNIILASTAKLTNDVLSDAPITFIASTSEKVAEKYTILLKQYALTKEAFQFWEDLKKNTEQLGSIFDAQPSQLKGNIHSVTDASEPVIGYMSAGTVSKLRVFIPNGHLPPEWTKLDMGECLLLGFYFKHIEGDVVVNDEDFYFNYNKPGQHSLYIPVSAIVMPFVGLVGHTGALPQCVDCTLRGSNKPPVFWQ